MAKIKLELIPGSTNYGAVPVRIAQVYPIPGADNIVRTVIEGNDVIIVKNDIVVGDKVYIFVQVLVYLKNIVNIIICMIHQKIMQMQQNVLVIFLLEKEELKQLNLKG